MNNPILSICIPTFNRAECLKQSLSAMAMQLAATGALADEVEIVICDNASQDNTAEVVDRFTQNFSNFRYFKNQTNLGFDRNVLRVVQEARGQYCWLMGDDDMLFERALEKIVAELKMQKAEYYVVNTWGYNHELTEAASPAPGFVLKENVYFENLAKYIKTIGNYKDLVGNFGGMSGQIFKTEVWRALPNKEKYLNSQTIHLFVLLEAFKNLPFAIFAEALVKTRGANMRWDTFPGLESFYKRASFTHRTLIWILDLYSIPYANWKLEAYFYFELVKNMLTGLLKKVLFSSNFAKKTILPKIKILLNK